MILNFDIIWKKKNIIVLLESFRNTALKNYNPLIRFMFIYLSSSIRFSYEDSCSFHLWSKCLRRFDFVAYFQSRKLFICDENDLSKCVIYIYFLFVSGSHDKFPRKLFKPYKTLRLACNL